METDGPQAAPATGSLGQEESPSRNLLRRRIVTDASCEVVDRKDYEPYGVEIRPATNSAGNTHQYTGHERDAATGLDYMHYRFYGSNMGRFMKPDNIMGNLANPQSWNLYSYVGNNPVNRNDPTGHMWQIMSLKSAFGFGGGQAEAGSNIDSYISPTFGQIAHLFNVSALDSTQQTMFMGSLWNLYSTSLGSMVLSSLADQNIPVTVLPKATGTADTVVQYQGAKITGFTMNVNFSSKSDVSFMSRYFPTPFEAEVGGKPYTLFQGKAFGYRGGAGLQWRLASIIGHEVFHMAFYLANPALAIEYQALTNEANAVGRTYGQMCPEEAARMKYLSEQVIEPPAYEFQAALDAELQGP